MALQIVLLNWLVVFGNYRDSFGQRSSRWESRETRRKRHTENFQQNKFILRGGATSGSGMRLDWRHSPSGQLELCTRSLARSYSVALSPSFFHPYAPALPPGSRALRTLPLPGKPLRSKLRACVTPRPIPSQPSPSPRPFPILVPVSRQTPPPARWLCGAMDSALDF